MKSLLTSVIIVNYNGLRFIDECLSALKANSDRPIEIIIIDNASNDGSAAYIHAHYPEVKLVESSRNLGYSKAINLGVTYASGDYLVILNMDIIVSENWLSHLTDFLDENSDAGAVNPCLLLYNQPQQINALGQNVHITGLGFNRKLHKPVAHADLEPIRVTGLQGGAFALKTETFRKIGGMNEHYFLYHEDVELSLRLKLAGYNLYVVPGSTAQHKYALHMTPQKLHWLERYRWVTLLSTYHTTTLFALIPLFFLTEMLMGLYCLVNGIPFMKAKRQAIRWVYDNRDDIIQSRRKTQSIRQIGDWSLLMNLRWGYDWDQFLYLVKR